MTSEKNGSVIEIRKESFNAKRFLIVQNSGSYERYWDNQRSDNFFNQSANRNQVLKEIIGGQLLQLCEIRWVERHNTIITFYSLLPELVEAFAEISE